MRLDPPVGAPYVELRCRSAFSFGDGTVSPEALVQRAARLGYDTLGLCDAADMGGVVRFLLETTHAGIAPIIGTELVVDGCPAAFLARSPEGYRNLAALVTRARSGTLRGWERSDPAVRRALAGKAARTPRTPPRRGRPCVSWADVRDRSAGLYALTGEGAGPVAARLRANDRCGATRLVAEWREVFGAALSIEVQDHGAGWEERALGAALIALAERTGTPWVITHGPRYIDGPSWLLHDVLTALRAGKSLEAAERDGDLLPSAGWALEPVDVMHARWSGREAGLQESGRIAAVCAGATLAWLRPPLPAFAVPPGHDDDSFLRQCAYDGARERWGMLSEAHVRQLDHELTVIKTLGFAGFFLVMWEAVRWATERGILAQGRGSAANSAVAYCLGVTAVDPVRHGLLFERFLSAARTDGNAEAPDIDVDIEHERREEVLDYMYAQYGRDRSAITGMIQTYRAPNAVLDVMRGLGYPPALALQVSKRLHDYDPAIGAEMLRTSVAAKVGLDVSDARGRTLLGAIAACHGLPRMRSTHPGGFVLSRESLGDYLPIEPTAMGRTVAQLDKDDLDAVGIPKFDFLGLGGLSVVRRAFDVIALRTGERPSLYRLPPDDAATYAMISRGDTLGTFQIESRAQIASVVHTLPTELYDIVVQVALIRPGPIQAKFVHPYTARRRGLEPVTYPHPALEPILRRTQGIPIFQEQAMAIAMTLGGYTGGEADELRRTMGHRRKLEKLRGALERLTTRMCERGIDPGMARGITDDLVSFANYGFPESHAWSFALVAYATAYLKCHYPAAFLTALLNAYPMGFYPPSSLVHDALRHGVTVVGPCLRDGAWECQVSETDAVRIGWRYVRGLGARAEEMLTRAQSVGPFGSIADVVARTRAVAPPGLSAAELTSLAEAGAFAVWEPDRRQAAWVALGVVGNALPLAPGRNGAAGGNDGYVARPVSRIDLIALEYRALGLSTVGHPMERFRGMLADRGAMDSRGFATAQSRDVVEVAGLVIARQRPESANGTMFLLLEDEWGSMNIVVWRDRAARYSDAVRGAQFLLVSGVITRDESEVSVIGQRFERLDGAVTHRSRDFR